MVTENPDVNTFEYIVIFAVNVPTNIVSYHSVSLKTSGGPNILTLLQCPYKHRGGLQGRGASATPHAPGKKNDSKNDRQRFGEKDRNNERNERKNDRTTERESERRRDSRI